jgi:hypothetical protein
MLRVTPRVRALIEEFAVRNTIATKAGAPSVGGAARTILEIALSDQSQETMYRIAYANARADVIQSVSVRYGRLIEELSKL